MTRKFRLSAIVVLASLPMAAQAAALNEDELHQYSTDLTRHSDLKSFQNKDSCSEFLAAQGTTSQFFPPVPDYVGWTDADFTTFALVDYAGLANEWIKDQPGGESLGTMTRCSVRLLRDGRVEVRLITRRALGFAQAIADLEANEFDFLATPTIFGATAQAVVADEGKPTLGTVVFRIAFHPSDPSKPLDNLPDLLDIVFDEVCEFSPAGEEPAAFSFKSKTFGKLTDDGSPALMRVKQVASYECSESADPAAPDEGRFVFTKEIVEIKRLGDDD